MRAPDFWRHDGWRAKLLSPLAALWRFGADYRATGIESYRAAIPVICVGNVVAGGAGKTPVAIALAHRLHSLGVNPHMLLRGYGGREAGPLLVNHDRHTVQDVGDEALLLAAIAPTWIARWRPDGAKAAAQGGAPLLIMDDGFQNHTLHKDLSFLVVDGAYGFGNGRLIPAGPCREDPASGLARADAVVIIGDDQHQIAAQTQGKPVLRAQLVPTPDTLDLKRRRVVAFAGIGRPEKFFRMLERTIGAEVLAELPFADHHPYTAADIAELMDEAKRLDALLVTTPKDWVRLPPQVQMTIRAVTVALDWDDTAPLDRLLTPLFGPAR